MPVAPHTGPTPNDWRYRLGTTVKLLFYLDRRLRPETPAEFAVEILIGIVWASLKEGRTFPEFRPPPGSWPDCLAERDQEPALFASILRAFYAAHDLEWLDPTLAETIYAVSEKAVHEAYSDP